MIRKMRQEDAENFYKMTELFYSSDAVLHPIPQEYHRDTFNEIMRSNVYLEGYLFEFEDKPAGYAITTKSYSHEAGGIILWIDELYVLKEYRSKGIGKEFFKYLKSTLGNSIVRLRLEVAANNGAAMEFYKKMGFSNVEYIQIFKDRQSNS